MRAWCQLLISLLPAAAALPVHSQASWRAIVELRTELQVTDMKTLQEIEALLQGPDMPAYGGRCSIERSLDLNQPAHPHGLWWLGARCELPPDGAQARRLHKDLQTLGARGLRVLQLDLLERRIPIPPYHLFIAPQPASSPLAKP